MLALFAVCCVRHCRIVKWIYISCNNFCTVCIFSTESISNSHRRDVRECWCIWNSILYSRTNPLRVRMGLALCWRNSREPVSRVDDYIESKYTCDDGMSFFGSIWYIYLRIGGVCLSWHGLMIYFVHFFSIGWARAYFMFGCMGTCILFTGILKAFDVLCCLLFFLVFDWVMFFYLTTKTSTRITA